jgi:group I intron endonuclease
MARKDKPGHAGIYAILCSSNNKRYVGSSVNIRIRWADHRCDLRKDRHHSPILQASWNKYGADQFKWGILEVCSDDDDENLLEREQYWMDRLKSCSREKGMNVMPIAQRSPPILNRKKLTPEQIRAIKDNLASFDKSTVQKIRQAKIDLKCSHDELANMFESSVRTIQKVMINESPYDYETNEATRIGKFSISEIFSIFMSDKNHSELGREYDVSNVTIANVRNRRSIYRDCFVCPQVL